MCTQAIFGGWIPKASNALGVQKENVVRFLMHLMHKKSQEMDKMEKICYPKVGGSISLKK
jgi:hypothetical protein